MGGSGTDGDERQWCIPYGYDQDDDFCFARFVIKGEPLFKPRRAHKSLSFRALPGTAGGAYRIPQDLFKHQAASQEENKYKRTK